MLSDPECPTSLCFKLAMLAHFGSTHKGDGEPRSDSKYLFSGSQRCFHTAFKSGQVTAPDRHSTRPSQHPTDTLRNSNLDFHRGVFYR